MERTSRLASLGANVTVPGEAAYLLAALGVIAGVLVAGDRGALVGGIVGYFGVKSMQSLAWSFCNG